MRVSSMCEAQRQRETSKCDRLPQAAAEMKRKMLPAHQRVPVARAARKIEHFVGGMGRVVCRLPGVERDARSFDITEAMVEHESLPIAIA